MSKNKKKNHKPGSGRSVLDEPILKAKEPSGTPDDAIESAEAAVSFAETVLSEDDSVSDLPRDTDIFSVPESTRLRASGEDIEYSGDADDAYDGGISGEDGYPGGEDFDDDFPDELPADPQYGAKPPVLERIIEYVSAALSVFMLGASLVFWYFMLRFLTRSPYSLSDPVQMRVLLAGCALLPAAVVLVQHRLRRPVSAERWLICLCVSGALATLLVIAVQTLIRHAGYTVSELPLTLCCAVSGCALPSAIYLGLRRLTARFRGYLRAENRKNWDTVRRDVLSLTGFDRT